MPAKRLPWAKVWPEMLDHEKFVGLPDRLTVAWLRCVLKGSQQPIRWRFASVEHAAGTVGRPVKEIRDLITLRLLDQVDELSDAARRKGYSVPGLWVHDWKEWQERHPSDFGGATLGDDSANAAEGSSLLEGTLREHSGKAPARLRDDSPNAPSTLPHAGGHAGARTREEGRREKGEQSHEPNGSGRKAPQRGSAPTATAEPAGTPASPPTTRAVQEANKILHKRCDETDRKAINAAVPESDAALRKWVAVLEAFRLRQPGSQGLATPLEWYANGIPPQGKGRGTGQGHEPRGFDVVTGHAERVLAAERERTSGEREAVSA